MPTSPLLKGSTPQICSLLHKGNGGTTDESNLDEDNLPRQPLSTPAECHRKAAVHALLNSDDQSMRPKPVTNRNSIVLSEDEVLSNIPNVTPRAFEKPNTEIDILGRSKSVVVLGNQIVSIPCGSGLQLPLEKTDVARDNDVLVESQSIPHTIRSISPTSMLATDCPGMAKTGILLSHLSYVFPWIFRLSATVDVNIDNFPATGQKRAAAQDPIPDLTASESNFHPSKRFRGENSSTTDLSMSTYVTRQLPKSKRYGGKGRTSSPARLTTDEVDFNELPAALTEYSIERPKAQIVAMKSKAGKNTLTEKPVSGRPKAKRDMMIAQQAVTRAASKDHALIVPKAPDQKLSSNIKVIQLCDPVDFITSSNRWPR